MVCCLSQFGVAVLPEPLPAFVRLPPEPFFADEDLPLPEERFRPPALDLPAPLPLDERERREPDDFELPALDARAPSRLDDFDPRFRAGFDPRF